ncbi:MAG: hypothetical protein KDJ29_19635 [Hyphomicrobiales bacterium]|nr:hypothetical protein [Hyphomicrobiales bacterium]
MNRNTLYGIIGVLAVAIIVIGYMYYQERQKSGIQIELGKNGVSIEAK